MARKNPKFPNKVEGRGTIEIPPEAPVCIQRKWESKTPAFVGGITRFTFTTKVDPDFVKALNYIPETSAIPNETNSAPSWYHGHEKKDSEIANMRHKARELLDHHFSVGKIVNEFGNSKFPTNAMIICKCGEKLEYVVDYFTHAITQHGNSLNFAVKEFNDILDKLANIEPW